MLGVVFVTISNKLVAALCSQNVLEVGVVAVIEVAVAVKITTLVVLVTQSHTLGTRRGSRFLSREHFPRIIRDHEGFFMAVGSLFINCYMGRNRTYSQELEIMQEDTRRRSGHAVIVFRAVSMQKSTTSFSIAGLAGEETPLFQPVLLGSVVTNTRNRTRKFRRLSLVAYLVHLLCLVGCAAAWRDSIICCLVELLREREQFRSVR